MSRTSLVRAALVVALGAGAAPSLVAAGDPAPAGPAPSSPAPASSVGEIKKEHNVDMPNGRKAVRLTVPAEIVGQQGKTVWAAAWFTDPDDKPVPSNDPAYADPSGTLKVVSVEFTAAKDHESEIVTFLVPYFAFPKRKEGKYQVVAHVKLVRRDSPKNTVLATGSTSFFVEG